MADNIWLRQEQKNEDCEWAVRSLIGKRERQEDSAGVIETKKVLLATVCDGMGGMPNGDQASRTAIKMMEQFYCEAFSDNPPAFYQAAIIRMDQAVANLKTPEGKPAYAGTTIVSCMVRRRELFWMSVGDSRLYLLRKGEIIQATRDHNNLLRVDSLLRQGRIRAEEYEKELLRKEALISFIGKGGIEWQDISINPLELQNGDIIILATDGFYRGIEEAEIIRKVRETNAGPIEELANALELCLMQKQIPSQDNATFIIIKMK